MLWGWVDEITGKQMGTDFELVARYWLSDKKIKSLNILTSAMMWNIWKTCNDLCFQNVKWTSMKVVAWSGARMLRD
jgi:hypothetical protein